MKRTLLIATGIVVVLSAYFTFTGIGRWTIVAVTNSIFDPGPPPIIGQVVCNDYKPYGECDSASAHATAVILRRFPIGSSALEMEEALTQQGFQRIPEQENLAHCLTGDQSAPVSGPYVYCPSWDPRWVPRNDLEYHWGSLPCDDHVEIMWSIDAKGDISHLEATYRHTCL
jgi:hypothetical protein